MDLLQVELVRKTRIGTKDIGLIARRDSIRYSLATMTHRRVGLLMLIQLTIPLRIVMTF